MKLGGPASAYQKLDALALGWRMRRIMKLKDCIGRKKLILDHDDAKNLEELGEQELAESRRTSVKKFIIFLNAMETNG